MNDPYDLQRFVEAQQPLFDSVCAELRAGRKRTHWMWFVFPQIEGLGHSAMARKFAISSLQEARAYLEHPLLGPRLRQCSRIVAELDGRTIEAIFAYPDDMKFQSAMTLFAQASADNQVFNDCLQKYFGGVADADTLAQLS
ncbi:DUF1810 domain-containing protein [Paraherbaspirillum soli]|uniref:DUF1810 domain-containing protein n=1 Tax=Paraherbaspirillum soli TaxID=631222 RepID=A0ABW0MBU2_9BURK